MDISIREYRESDRAALELCIAELQAHIGAIDPLHKSRTGDDFDVRKYCDYTLQKVDALKGKIFMAEQDGKAAGCIIGVITKPSELDQLEGYPSKDGKILELIVLSQFRHKGLGVLLMQALEKYFRTQECKNVLVDCFAPNVEAHEFYKKSGYADRMTVMLKTL